MHFFLQFCKIYPKFEIFKNSTNIMRSSLHKLLIHLLKFRPTLSFMVFFSFCSKYWDILFCFHESCKCTKVFICFLCRGAIINCHYSIIPVSTRGEPYIRVFWHSNVCYWKLWNIKTGMELGGNTFPLSSIYCKITFEVFSILHFAPFPPIRLTSFAVI